MKDIKNVYHEKVRIGYSVCGVLAKKWVFLKNFKFQSPGSWCRQFKKKTIENWKLLISFHNFSVYRRCLNREIVLSHHPTLSIENPYYRMDFVRSHDRNDELLCNIITIQTYIAEPNKSAQLSAFSFQIKHNAALHMMLCDHNLVSFGVAGTRSSDL